MSLEIVLDKTSESFSPGETISGVVRVTTDEERHCKYLTILLEGIGRVKIFDKEYNMNEPELTQSFLVHKEEEVYLTETVQVSGGNETVPKGVTDFPFKVSLPSSGLPCTFETTQDRALGGITYWMTASMQTGGLDEMTYKLPFTMLGYLDLNKADLDSFKRFQQTETFRFCCICCRSNPVTIVLTIPKRALVSGESIRFRVDLDNPSRRKLKRPKMELVTRVTCLAHGRIRTEEIVLKRVEGPEVKKKSKQAWDERRFKVPIVENSEKGIPPTDLGEGCSIMHTIYFLRFTMKRPKCEGQIEIDTQLLIGTVPLDESYQ